MTKRYTCHIVDSEGNYIESNIPGDESQAETVLKFIQERDNRTDLEIIKIHCPQAKGLGRDPDLH